jgi:chromosome segregation ATPase
VDLTVVIFGVLLAVTAVAGYEYYRQIRKVHQAYQQTQQEIEKTHQQYEQSVQEYGKAKEFLEDIVLSFNRELKRQSDKFDSMVSRVESSYATAEASYSRAERLEKTIEPIETQLIAISQTQQILTHDITVNLSENIQNNTNLKTELSSEMATLQAKLQEALSAQQVMQQKLAVFEEQVQKLSVAPSTPASQAEVMLPAVPIKRDKALAALTETEITVLEMLHKEGPKTAPEIKDRVGLSREHTARLMKKIYEEGYVEREAGKIPFRYTIKKEMEALLQKTEPSPAPAAPPA